jgi:hypothetical protein
MCKLRSAEVGRVAAIGLILRCRVMVHGRSMSDMAWYQHSRRSNKSILSRMRTMTVGVLFLVSSCFSQDKGGVDHRHAVPVVQKILSNAQLSGSLENWGLCDISDPHPEFPPLRRVSSQDGTALEALQELFANDPKMQVTQETNGRIRMVETDVPKDFLEVKIHHLSFPSDFHSGTFAVYFILNTPEVIAFMDQNIGRKVAWYGWGMPGQIAMHGASVPGELNDVTVEQALDYVLQTFPGFWFYQNCHDPQGGRKISVGFLQDLPLASAASLPKTE